MADTTDSRSSSGGLSHILSKTSRRSKKDRESPSPSAASLESTDSDGQNGNRRAVRRSLDKLMSPVETFEDMDSNSGLGKLLAKGIGNKRRKKKQQQEEDQRASEEAARGRSVADRGTLENELQRESHESGDADDNSILTYDSDPESARTTPPLSTHPSHVGYLTTSSPLVKATTLSDTSTLTALDAQLDGENTPKAANFPTVDTLAASESNPDLTSGTLQTPANASQKRASSPVGRFKEALSPRRGTSPKTTSPERKAGGVTAAVATKETPTLAEKRRGSVASRLGSIFPDKNSSQTTFSSGTSSPERPRTAKITSIDTSATPRTPPSIDRPAPIIVNTPPTPTEPVSGSLRFSTKEPASPDRPSSETGANPNVVVSPSGNMISHRRNRSGSGITLGPSKLSNITSAPLTPTPEVTSPGQGGFFSSVFSAAQNAANTLSSSIANTSAAPGQTRSRSVTQEPKEPESPVVESLAEKADTEHPVEQKELAVKTLGMGDLSLSHLGISETASGSNTPTASKFAEPHELRGGSEFMMSEEQNSGMGATNGLGLIGEDSMPASLVEDTQSAAGLRSAQDSSIPGEQTPPNGSVFEGKVGIHRSGSIRSAMGNRRHRGSSAATGQSTIGAAIAAANSSLARPNSEGTPKLTGFAVASKKRNRDFHNLFRSVPDDDYLIEDYSCALQREILAHGRLYVSEGHLCFSSNIFGWVTTLVMSFDEIVSVEKRSTALLFKNGLMISTLHAKNIFASFTSRDSTYDLIVGIWKLGHPSLRSSLNGVRLEETGGGDKTEKDDGTGGNGSQSSGSDDESDDGDEVYDEDEDDEDGMSFTQAEGSVAGSDVLEKVVSRKPSAAVVNGASSDKSKEGLVPSTALDFSGPATHAPTDCTDRDTHYDKILADEVIQAPLGKVFSLVFGQASGAWMRNWLLEDQKCIELTLDENTKPLSSESKIRNYSYIKPLSGAIGPKQTKCLSTETLDALDFEKSASVTISTQTPDVPSGNVFSTKTKYCLSWGEGNSTRLQINYALEWTGKSWIKGPIEKGAGDGQVKYAKELIASLKAAVSNRRGTTTTATGGKLKKKGRKGRESKDGVSKTTDGARDSKPDSENWGILEPLRGLLGPIVDIIKPLLTGNILYGLLVGLLVASWFRYGFTSHKGIGGRDVGLLGTPERVAAYEEIWKREESELWNWLEERVSMDRLHESQHMPARSQDIEGKLRDEKMNEREVQDAIRVTEERLRVLKDVVAKKKDKKAEEGSEPRQA
ncbi:hypothetical protein BP6252_05278 [Coleophoma cylindrospora]|uniref:VASt domain-containing protein n=1 Tax=Coleophoma cylindrospora TaxID=1849047 RepID=A0A3D8RT96_9HELO|nr:hypothetical protein BP6252_05278 [Coleophoma cylindrospora]